MHPNLAKNYICYFPTENVFKRMKDESELTFISRKNRKRYNTIHIDSQQDDAIPRKSVIYNVYINNKNKPKKKMLSLIHI